MSKLVKHLNHQHQLILRRDLTIRPTRFSCLPILCRSKSVANERCKLAPKSASSTWINERCSGGWIVQRAGQQLSSLAARAARLVKSVSQANSSNYRLAADLDALPYAPLGLRPKLPLEWGGMYNCRQKPSASITSM